MTRVSSQVASPLLAHVVKLAENAAAPVAVGRLLPSFPSSSIVRSFRGNMRHLCQTRDRNNNAAIWAHLEEGRKEGRKEGRGQWNEPSHPTTVGRRRRHDGRCVPKSPHYSQ